MALFTRRLVATAIALTGLLLALPGAYALDVAVELGGVAPLWDAEWRTPDGLTHTGINGEGVIALQREGFAATHPDLAGCSDPDYNVFDIGAQGTSIHVPSPITDKSAVSHGTLVTGVFCARGDSTDGDLRGVAPEATMFAIDRTANLGTSDLSDWYRDHNLRLFTDSTGADSVDLLDRLGLSNADLVLLDAVGNSGGDGGRSTTVPHLNDDPRKVGVAASNKDRSDVAFYSSKGGKTDPDTWPSITAPGCVFTTMPTKVHTIGTLSYAQQQVSTNQSCVTVGPETFLQRTMNQYTQVAGTSFATPFTAGVFALVFEVNPALNATDAIHLVTRTADAFLETPGFDHLWQQTNESFFEEHGWQAGWGHVNATRAVAAAHYLVLDPEASLEEAIACWSIGTSKDARLVLNPEGSNACDETSETLSPAIQDSIDPQGDTPVDKKNDLGAGHDAVSLHGPAPDVSQETPAPTVGLIVIVAALWLYRRFSRRSMGPSSTKSSTL